jgi:hypothetical protein
MVGSQTANLTLGPSFDHNLCCRCPNGSCEAIFDIYTAIPFQRYKEHLKERYFDPCNRVLKFLQSQRTPCSHFWECESYPHTCLKVGLQQSRIFNGWTWKRLEWHKIRSLHGRGMIDHLGSIHLSYAWLCIWKHPFSLWPKGESPRALHIGQTLPWRAVSTRCGTMRFLCALVAQLVDQPCTTFNSIVGFEIHHQKPQLACFSHIGWLKLLPTSYKARETSLVSYEHNRKTKRCFAHLYLLPMNTYLPRRWTRPGLSSCFSHLGWTEPRRNKKGYGVPN